MQVIENSKLAIIGAGAVGTSIAYASLIRSAAHEIVLYDVDRARVEAEVLDLEHGTPFAGASRIGGGADISGVENANVVVVTAGAKQKPGQSRLDLAATNIGIIRDLMPKLVERAPNAVYVIVSNPCDVLTVAAREFSGLPATRIFASGTVLDSGRLRWLLARRLGVAASSVHAMIVGEHGDSEFPLWSQARIGPVPLAQWRVADGALFGRDDLETIASDVKNAAYRIIAGKGATNFAIGLSATRIVEAVLNDEGAILPVSSVLKNYHGVSGVALSVPTLINSSGIERVIDVPFDADELARFEASASAMSAVLDSLGVTSRG
ncbi:MAG: L-lactate dehydrogenase [Lacisediminihabitans sp.]